MDKKTLLKKKKEIIKKLKTKKIDEESIRLLSSLGFNVKYDEHYNLYVWDNINDKKMYTNTLSIAGIPFRTAENEYRLLEFTLMNKHIDNIKVYDKNNGYKLVYKK